MFKSFRLLIYFRAADKTLYHLPAFSAFVLAFTRTVFSVSSFYPKWFRIKWRAANLAFYYWHMEILPKLTNYVNKTTSDYIHRAELYH